MVALEYSVAIYHKERMLLVFLAFVGILSQTVCSEEQSNPLYQINKPLSIVNLASQVHNLKNNVRFLRTARMKAKIELLRRVAELERARVLDMREFNKRITDLKGLRETDSYVIKNLTAALKSLKSENAALRTKLDHEKASVSIHHLIHAFYIVVTGSSEATVAFHTILTRPLIDPGVHQSIIFDKIITNVGAQYSRYTGIFTCNQPGVYVFSWQILLEDSNYIISEIAKNGKSVGSQEIGNAHYTVSGSSTAVVELAQGDEILVRIAGLSEGSDVLSDITMFSGFRLP
ncbi:uncharacterized protein LOC132563264 [Ylistrum balloti]|uniref:uncharacterized protein LOC132563264 n=1 Tax=Ylistrum balloti TaxID=509963 RepID=UPI002905ABBC|nr:uncharacterized protein LOC132563264 [Ylistrum balloti]